MDSLVERAKELAHRAHAGQVDKAGRPYIEHVARVAAAVRWCPHRETVAWLHDVLEDCRYKPEWDEIFTFPGFVSMACMDLTRHAVVGTDEYYAAINRNPIALSVKLADIADNADETRLALLDDKTAAKLRRKYADARKALGGGE